ncbi:MAG: FAD-dependent oxidoreductase [Chloroflexi bacterium]|nr:FAD-dependent oxidoreductase [Chloroflexota bacterium]
MKKQYDVIVVGGGPSGITAALAAGRANVSTLLIERYGFLGGMSSSALVYPWFTFHDLSGNQVIKGIAQEIVDHLIERGGSPGHLRDSSGFVWSVTPFDKEVYKSLALDLLSDANVDILLHSFVSELQVTDRKITSLKTVGKYGNAEVKGKLIIDATGDADVAALSGAPCVLGRPNDGKVQAMTYIFRLGGVKVAPIKAYYLEHPDEFYTPAVPVDSKNLPLTGVSGFFKHWKKAPASIPRDRFLFFIGPRPGEITVNTTRILDIDPTRAEPITRAEITGRKQAELLTTFMQESLPGFENSFLLETPSQIGVRESRRIAGQFQLSETDIINSTAFPDGIARCGYPIDIHMPDNAAMTLIDFKKSYEIPYRVLLPQRIDNLLVTGRAVSSSHDAFASLRVTAPVMALGQAAGSAAALYIKMNTCPADVDIGKLQTLLIENNMVL